jgi:hypothetical protein
MLKETVFCKYKVGNADKTAVSFDMPVYYAINFKGEKQVAINYLHT